MPGVLIVESLAQVGAFLLLGVVFLWFFCRHYRCGVCFSYSRTIIILTLYHGQDLRNR